MERPSIREQALEWAVRTCALGEDAFAILGRAQLYEEWLNSPEKFDAIQKAEGVQHDEEQIFRANRTAFANDAGPNMEPPLCEHTQHDPSLPTLLKKIREDTIRECIEALPGKFQPAVDALESLLPKKDRAKSLLEQFERDPATEWGPGDTSHDESIALDFANWLISNNLINEKGAL